MSVKLSLLAPKSKQKLSSLLVSVHLVQTKLITVECWKLKSITEFNIFIFTEKKMKKKLSVFISSFAIFTPSTQNKFEKIRGWKCNQFQLLTFILQFLISVENWTLSSTFNFPLFVLKAHFWFVSFNSVLSLHSLIHNDFQFSVTMDGHYLEMPL